MANGRISLTGRRAAAAANNTPNLNRRRGVAPRNAQHQVYSLFTRHSFLILAVGILMGYVLLPLLMIETQMDDLMHHLPTNANSDFMMYTGRMNGKAETTTTPADNNKNPYLRPVDSDVMSKPTRNLDVLSKEGVAGTMSEVEKRIVEDHDFLSRQSVPTYTTPFIMKTAKLPDHLRMKILITGGAGFVGSHLVDKLMMEGHEVIVVDNFFTGQKKNIAHWLHHPNFRYDTIDRCVIYVHVFSVFSEAAPDPTMGRSSYYMQQHLRISLSHTYTPPLFVLLCSVPVLVHLITIQFDRSRCHGGANLGSRPSLSSRLPRLSTALPVQPRQNYQNQYHGHSEHAGSR
jgi:hypothetical protein